MTTLDNGIEETLSRGIILTITLVAALLFVLNVILISCYVRRKAQKRLNGNNNFLFFSFPDLLLFSSVEATPTDTAQVVVGVAVAVPVLVLFNAVLLFVLIKRRAIKGSSASSSASGKTSLNGGDSKNSASEGNFCGGWVHAFFYLFLLLIIHT